jgi:nucleoside-diphosphate-sugar epimerase
MSILVTGAGVIGSHTAAMLQDRGEKVHLLDIAPSLEAIDSVVDIGRINVIKADIVDYEALRSLVREHGITHIVHTAAMLTRAVIEQPRSGVMVNVLGTTNILEVARELKLARVVLASSTTVGYPTFGSFEGDSFPEDFRMRVVSERPNSLYTVSKLSGEHIALFYRDQYGVDAVVVRYGAVLSAWAGPNKSLPGRMMLSLLEPAMQGRTAVIDDPFLIWKGGEEFVDARDCAQGNVAALYAAQPQHAVYNISCGEMYTFDDVISAVRELYPSLKVEMRIELKGGLAGFPWERPAASDISLAQRDLGYASRYSLKDSIRHFAAAIGGKARR